MATIKQLALEDSKALDRYWNPELKMIKRNIYTHHHHQLFTPLARRQDVHMPRENLYYASTMMDSQDAFYFNRGCEIMEAVIGYQETDPNDPCCGSWSWFAEEKASAMIRRDDNWADFCGNAIIRAYIKHNQKMPESLFNKIKPCLELACNMIIKRDTPPSYTNIAVLGASTVLLTGEVFEIIPYIDYALNRLRKILAYTRDLGTFEEYNSPTYANVTLNAFENIYLLTENDEAKNICHEHIELIWKEIAMHFHPDTKQWGGPHSRCYNSLLDINYLTRLQNATGLELGAPKEKLLEPEEWGKIHTCCPEKYLCYFTDNSERIVENNYNKSHGVEFKACQYMSEDLSFGTFSREHFWEQRSNFILYTLNNSKPVYAVLRSRVGDEHFTGTALTCSQYKKQAVFGINYTSDTKLFGMTPREDLKNGVLETDYLAIEIEIGGGLGGITAVLKNKEFILSITGKHYYFSLLDYGCDIGTPKLVVKKTDSTIHLACIIHEGEMKTFDLSEFKKSWFLFSFSCHEPIHAVVKVNENRANAYFEAENKQHGVEIITTTTGIVETMKQNHFY